MSPGSGPIFALGGQICAELNKHTTSSTVLRSDAICNGDSLSKSLVTILECVRCCGLSWHNLVKLLEAGPLSRILVNATCVNKRFPDSQINVNRRIPDDYVEETETKGKT